MVVLGTFRVPYLEALSWKDLHDRWCGILSACARECMALTLAAGEIVACFFRLPVVKGQSAVNEALQSCHASSKTKNLGS